MDNRQMDNGQMDNGRWTVDDGQWTMDNGQWTIVQLFNWSISQLVISQLVN